MKKEYKRNLLIALGITAFLIPMTKCTAESETQAMDESVKNISYDKDEFLEGNSLYVMPEGEKVMIATVTKPVKKVEKVKVAEKKKEVKKNEPDESKWSTFEATYYSPKCNGCSGITKVGIQVKNTIYFKKMRIIAVDPKLIPLWSIVQVKTPTENFTALAGDVGGGIKGYRVDILVKDTKTAYKLGRHDVQIKVIGKYDN